MKTVQHFAQQTAGKKLLTIALATILVGSSASAFASGFQLFEENVSSVANYGAGGAAEAADASTNFFNPAGLTRIKNWQVVGAATGIWARTEFTGNVTSQLLGPTGAPLPIPPLVNLSGTADGDSFNVVPAAFFAAPINDRAVFGIGVTAPFGLETDYSQTAFTRYAATKSKVETININPNIALKVTDNISVGAGIAIEQFTAKLNSVTTLGNALPFNSDSTSTNYAHDWGTGWNAGILFTSSDDNTRAGLSFRSEIKHNAKGGSVLDGPLTPLLSPDGSSQPIFNPNANTTITLPSTTMASIWHRFNPKWAVMGTVIYTHWSVFDAVVLNNVAGSPPVPGSGLPRPVTLPQNFRNTWRVSAGADYTVNDKLTLRGGLGWDQTPTNDADRSIRLPDNNRFAVAVGAKYQVTKNARLDFGYTHLFIKDAPINIAQRFGTTVVTTRGESKSSADLVGAQITYDIA